MTKQEIPPEEIDFHPLSFCDSGGRVFWWRGALYRGIRPRRASFYETLFEKGVIKRLIEDQYLVETELADLTVADFPVVLKHRPIRFVSYANEWCPEMLRAAGRFLSDLMSVLIPQGLMLSSANPWSLLFEGCRPLLVDLCDIVSVDDGKKGVWERFQEEFEIDFAQPLRLMAQGHGHVARWILTDYERKEIRTQFAELMGYRRPQSPSRMAYDTVIRMAGRVLPARVRPAVAVPARLQEKMLRGVRKLRVELERIPLPLRKPGRPGDETDASLPLTPAAGWTRKQQTVYEVLSDLRPATLLDVGSGQGWYSRLAASLGSEVVALDADEGRVGECYRAAVDQNLPILPLVMNVRYPSPGYGIANTMIGAATQRLGCEMVLALSLVHQLAIEQLVPLEQIGEAVASFSRRWVLIEFVPPDESNAKARAGYIREDLVRALERSCRVVRIMPSHPEPRALILCETKRPG